VKPPRFMGAFSRRNRECAIYNGQAAILEGATVRAFPSLQIERVGLFVGQVAGSPSEEKQNRPLILMRIAELGGRDIDQLAVGRAVAKGGDLGDALADPILVKRDLRDLRSLARERDRRIERIDADQGLLVVDRERAG